MHKITFVKKNWEYDSLSKKGISKNDFDIKDNDNNNNINR